MLLLAVAALAAAGAALDSDAAAGGGDGLGVGDGEGFGIGSGEGMGLSSLDGDPSGGGDWFQYAFVVFLVALVSILVLWLVQVTWAEIVEFCLAAAKALGIAVVAGIVVLVVWYVLSLLGGGGGGTTEGLLPNLDMLIGDSGAEESPRFDPPTAVLALIAGFGLLFGLLAARSSGDDEGAAETKTVSAGEPDSVQTAGSRPPTAHATIRDRAADNEVYESWLALADVADADPTADSPRTVATRAIDAGVEEGTAREITALFEEVRYGGRPASDDRQRRASRARSALEGDP